MSHEEPGGPYLEAIRRGLQFARELDRRCGPVHLLVGIAEGHGHAAAALEPGSGPSLRSVVAGDPGGDGFSYLHMQAQGAARSLAESRGEPPAAVHLLIALLDQGTPEVLRALSQAGLDPVVVRNAAADAIGATGGLPSIAMPPLTAAGTLDRPPLPVADLDGRAWGALCWRQEHLPLGRLRRPGDQEALSHLEWAAASRLAERLGLDDDQRFSLIWHHADAVHKQVARARPDLGEPSSVARRRRAQAMLHRRGRFRRLLGNATVGWGAWFSNRGVGLRDRWFRLRTTRSYRGAPQP